MKCLATALAVATALAFVPSQSRADQGVNADASAGLQVTTAVYRPADDAATVTDVTWGSRSRYRNYSRSYSYYPRSYNYGYYPRSYNYGYYPRSYNYGYSPRYNYSYRYNYGYPRSYGYNNYNYGYRPGLSFGFSF